jgi:hypothetical protein
MQIKDTLSIYIFISMKSFENLTEIFYRHYYIWNINRF